MVDWTHGIHYYSSTGPDVVMPCLKALWRTDDVEHSCRVAAHLDQHSRRLNYLRSGRGGAWEGGRKGGREGERRGGRDSGDKEERGIQSTKVVASLPGLPCLRLLREHFNYAGEEK